MCLHTYIYIYRVNPLASRVNLGLTLFGMGVVRAVAAGLTSGRGRVCRENKTEGLLCNSKSYLDLAGRCNPR